MDTAARRSSRAVSLTFALAAVIACAHAAPTFVTATYNGYVNGMKVGVIQEQFEVEGGNYRLVSDTKAIGLLGLLHREPVKFSSKGQVTREGLRPAQFEARRSAGEDPEVAAVFDWSQGQVTLRHHGKVESLPLPSGTHDRLSAMYQLLFLPLERMRQVDFSMTNGRKLDRYLYRITPDVEINTPLGRLKTLHLVKQREPGDPVAEVWLSTQHRHFPVKLLIIERDGMRFEQIIQSLELRD